MIITSVRWLQSRLSKSTRVVEQLKAFGIDAKREEDQSEAHAFVEVIKFISPRLIYNNLHSSRTSLGKSRIPSILRKKP